MLVRLLFKINKNKLYRNAGLKTLLFRIQQLSITSKLL